VSHAALADLTWRQVETCGASATCLVPVGSTEQHGPHLPLSTDTDIAVALAERVARRLPSAVVAPAVSFGASGEHEEFAGTISVGHDALEHLLVELGRSASASFARIVLVSTHGGNAESVDRAATRLRGEGRDVLVWSPRWSADAHAGRAETSIMLTLCPERVDLAAAETGNVAPLTTLMPVLRAQGVRAVSPNGVLGDPAGASADEGRRLLECAVTDFVAGTRTE
jgi:mycofactocin system creatininase family protein